MIPLIDSHVHTDDERLAADRAAVLQRARAAGVLAQIVPAVSQPAWPRLRALCREQEDLFACYGLHPCFLHEHRPEHIAELAVWLGRERPVAVGECGLDYAMQAADKAWQQELFYAQLALAREFDLPIVIHARKAVEDVIQMIRGAGHYRGLVHSFNGSKQQAHHLIDLGYRLSFGGAVTYPRARRLRDLVAALPQDALLLETDAPDQVDSDHAGERNEPAYVLAVCRHIADLREVSVEALADSTTRNAIDLFQLPVTLRRSV